MRLNLAGFDVEVEGLEDKFRVAVLGMLRLPDAEGRMRPRVVVNNPVIKVPAEEVIRRLIPFLVIIVAAIWISVLVLSQGK